jgi:hypothetical protein
VAPSAGLEAEAALLNAYDWGRPLPPGPNTRGPVALSYRWLEAAATYDPAHGLPTSPFATGRGHQEAEALRRLLKEPPARIAAALKALPLRESGTALALWRWGQARVRAGTFDLPLRRAWEDRLLAAGPALTRGYALRHALCWALADQDETRFATLRSAVPGPNELVSGFQRLFGLLRGLAPELRLWSLPGLDYQDLRLDQVASRIWICPIEAGALPELPAGTAWIIPSATADLEERDASLSEPLAAEGRALATRLQAGFRSARFAPSRSAFQRLGLLWFPILIELDGLGNVRSVRMGDAAPAQP